MYLFCENELQVALFAFWGVSLGKLEGAKEADIMSSSDTFRFESCANSSFSLFVAARRSCKAAS